jgi:transketolase
MTKDRILANAVRFLSIDAITNANSGHPGMPCGMADVATVLWRNFLKHNPNNPNFANRDRFILSNGHGSMLLYAILHLTGYDLSLDDIKNFRQLNSKTPGHPEHDVTPGVETTTGPLGQGLSNAVGIAIGEKHLASIFNKPGFNIVDHYTYVFIGDGCLMEGISHEVSSLAGTLQLNKLIAFYDDNKISIDGNTDGWFTDDTKKRFESYGWHVIPCVDGHNFDEIQNAIQQAKTIPDKPTLICCQTVIGFGSPTFAGTAKAHGAPFPEEEINKIRKQLNWQHKFFVIPEEIYSAWNQKSKGETIEHQWEELYLEYSKQYPELAKEFNRRIQNKLPDEWKKFTDNMLAEINHSQSEISTRQASNICIEYLQNILPELMGGSADLTCSNLTSWKNAINFTATSPHGRYINYGVREFGMSGIVNGLALYNGIIPYAGTFLTFSDYARNAIRLAALMDIRAIFVYTHDSIGLGEDGPTHQPIEHITSLRLIPNLNVWRPCDTVESAMAWISTIEQNNPSALVFSRQKIGFQQRNVEQVQNIKKGGYILKDSQNCQIILIATGSEVELAIKLYNTLKDQVKIRVVSMPCVEIFKRQSEQYKQTVLPENVVKRVAIEAGSSMIWHQFIGKHGKIIGVDNFGKSAKYKDLYDYFKINSDYLKEVILNLI